METKTLVFFLTYVCTSLLNENFITNLTNVNVILLFNEQYRKWSPTYLRHKFD